MTKFSKGDWVVHRRHGLGHIVRRTELCVGGEPKSYFEIKTIDSQVWVPTEADEDDFMRPISPRDSFQRALNVLEQEPEPLPDHVMARRKRMEDTGPGHTPAEMAALIRDMEAHHQRKRLPVRESRNLKRLKIYFAAEWAHSIGQERETLRQRLDSILQQAVSNASAQA